MDKIPIKLTYHVVGTCCLWEIVDSCGVSWTYDPSFSTLKMDEDVIYRDIQSLEEAIKILVRDSFI